MPFSAFDPVNEESSNEQAVNVVAEIERLKKSARPEVASRIAEIYRLIFHSIQDIVNY